MADDTTPDGAAERVRAFIDRWTAPDWLGRNDLQRIDDHELTIADLRALLDERKQLREVTAKLRKDHRDAYLVVMEERDKARNQLRAETAVAKELLQRNVELGTRLDAAEAKREDAEAALETLRGQIAKHTPAVTLHGIRRDGSVIHGGAKWCAEAAASLGTEHVVADTCGYLSEWRVVKEGGEPT